MKIRHEEYTIIVQAPFNRAQCTYGLDQATLNPAVKQVACQNDGDFSLRILNDSDHPMVLYANICFIHLLLRVIDWIRGD